MNCPTADELSRYVDELLTEEEAKLVYSHVDNCAECKRVVDAFRREEEFLKETLQSPALPDDFAAGILGQLEPVKRKKAGPWKKVLFTAAGLVLAVGLGAAINPSFAELLGGFFSSDQVDEGLQIATDSGLTERVDLEVEDQGITFRVEDVMADTSRVALSYQVLKNGKPRNTYFDFPNSDNSIRAFDQNGNEILGFGSSWWEGSDYGVMEFSLREHDYVEQLTIRFDLVELNGVDGSWRLDVPVDLREIRKLTKTVMLEDATYTVHGVDIALKKLQAAPSSIELFYETSFNKNELDPMIKSYKSLAHEFDTAISYHLEDDEGNIIYRMNEMTDERGHSVDRGMLSGSGEDGQEPGHVLWIDSLVPQKENPAMTFVLDGVYKTVPTDFSITLRPDELKKKPQSFEFEGNYMTIKSAKHRLTKGFVIKMEGGKEAFSSELANWQVTDEKGRTLSSSWGGSILDEKDAHGRFKTTMDLEVFDLNKVPEELTLHLTSVKQYVPVEEQWRVPLH